MMSSPIWRIHSQGMINSLSLPKKVQNFPGPGTISAVSRPVTQSNSTSMGHPRLRQVQILIISFCFNSHTRIGNQLCVPQPRLGFFRKAAGYRHFFIFMRNSHGICMGFVSTISEDFLNEIGSIINSMGLLSQALHDVRAKAGGRLRIPIWW